MADANTRERKRLRLSVPDTDSDSDAWNFLSPWFEQLEGRLVVVSDGYLQVLDPASRRDRHSQIQDRPQRYDVTDWHTREALELLVLVHSVSNQAWAKLLLEKCALRFADEEDPFNVNNDDDDDDDEEEEEDDDGEGEEEGHGVSTQNGDRSDDAAFVFECDHDREVPLSPRFRFGVDLGGQTAVGLVDWKTFFLSHTSDYEPSLEFLAAKRRVLMMQDDEFKKHPRVPRSVEIPVSLELDSGSGGFDAQMQELRELIHDMKSYRSQEQARDVKSLADCASSFTYKIELLSLDIVGVKLDEACGESVLRVLGTGIPIGALGLNMHRGPFGGTGVSRTALAKFFSELLVESSDPLLKIHSIDYLCFRGSMQWQYDALYASLARARTPVATLAVADEAPSRARVGLLAEALFFPPTSSRTSSNPSIRGLDISCLSLCKRHLQTIVDVVRGKGGRSGVEQSSDQGRLVEVIVPGYGVCQLPRGAVVSQEAKVGRGLDAASRETEPVNSLLMNFSGSSDTLENLMGQIGWPLRSLTLHFPGKLHATTLMTAILTSCPKLTSLSLYTSDVDLDQLITTYEQFGGERQPAAISSLALINVDSIGADDGVLFAEHLGDPTTRLAKHLLEFTIETGQESPAVNDSTLRALWFALKSNRKLSKLELTVERSILEPWKSRFLQFHGQVLPPVPVELPSKLAFLSVALARGGSHLPALQQVDQRTLSLVFHLAGTRVIRSVTMHYRM